MTTTVAVIQSRMGSSRLPGKVLRDLGGRPVLSWVIRAARESGCCDRIVVATTALDEDEPVAELACKEGVDIVRGSVDDVLSRFMIAIGTMPPCTVVRLTSDCPLLDPQLIRMAVSSFSGGDNDYLATDLFPSLPRGFDVEVVSSRVLREIDSKALGVDRTHVLSFLYRHPESYRLAGLNFLPRADDLRLTLDTREDAVLLDAIIREIGDRAPRWREVVSLLRARPDLVAINAGVRQRALEEG